MVNIDDGQPLLRAHVLELAGAGVRLWTDGVKLHHVGPPGAVTEAVAATLRANRQGVIDVLRGEGATHPAWSATAAQQSLWFTHQLHRGEDCAHALLTVLKLHETVDAHALDAALTAAVEHHEALRTCLTMQFGRLWQHVRPLVGPVVERHALRTVEPGEAERWIDAYAARPFDLSNGPVFRSALIEARHGNESERLLVFVVHHVAADFPALQTLLAELADRVAQPASTRPACGFRSHSAMLERLPAARRQTRCHALAQQLLPLPDPVQFTPEPVQRGDGPALYAAHAWPLPPAQTQAVLTLCRQWEVNPFVFCLALFSLAVARTSAQRSLLVNVATRFGSEPMPASMVGNLANLTPLRVTIEGGHSVRQTVCRIAEAWQRIAGFTDVPFAELVEHLGLSGQNVRCPLSPVAFAWHRDLAPVAEAQARLGKVLPMSRQLGPPGALLMTAHQSEVGLDFRLTYDPAQVSYSTVDVIAASVDALVSAAIALPDHRLDAMAQLPGSAASLWGAAPAKTPPPVLARILEQANEHPDRVLLRWVDGAVTASQLRGATFNVAQALLDRGVAPSDRIAVSMPRGPGMVAAALGIWQAGAVYVPVDVEYPSERRATLLAISGAAGIICQADGPTDASSVWHWTPDHASLFAAGSGSMRVPTLPAEATAYIIFTSGSTGTPKGVAIAHGAFDHFIDAFVQTVGLGAQHRYLAVSSTSFDASIAELFAPLAAGAQLSLSADGQLRDPESMQYLIERHDINMMQATPTFWRTLLRAFPDKRWDIDAHSMGEALPMDLARRMKDRFRSVWNLYGPTEATVYVAAHRIDAEHAHTGTGWVHAPVSKALAGNLLVVLDEWGHPVPDGVSGELHLAGPQLAQGYWEDTVRTTSSFVRGRYALEGVRLYRTGDVARVQAGHVELLGRRDHQIKLRGYRIELGELESQLRQLPGVDDAAACLDTRGTSPQLVAFYSGTESVAELEQTLRQRLPRQLVPSRLIHRGQLSANTNGKADRPALLRSIDAACVSPLPAPASADAALQTDLLRVLSGLLRRPVPPGQSDATLFDLGVDSITTLEFCMEVRRTLGCELAVSEVFEHPTINALARLLQERLARPAASAPSAIPRWQQDLEMPFAFSPIQAASTRVDRILLTGGTGYLGSRILHAMLTDQDAEIVCLVRATDNDAAIARIQETLRNCQIRLTPEQTARLSAVAGNSALPTFGLAGEAYAALAARVDTVVHCAALVNFSLPYESLRGNVVSTAEIVAFCGTERAKRLHFVSTYSVLDPDSERLGPVLDVVPHDYLEFGYARSKWVCEKLILRAVAQGLACRIYRPSRIVSATPPEIINSGDFYSLVLAASMASATRPNSMGADNFVGVRGVARCIARHVGRAFDDALAIHPLAPKWTAWSDITELMARCGHPTRAVPYPQWIDAAGQAALSRPGLQPFTHMLPFLNGAGDRLRQAFSRHLPALPEVEPGEAQELEVTFDAALVESHLRQIFDTHLTVNPMGAS